MKIPGTNPYNEEIYTRRPEDCTVIDAGNGETVRELAGKNTSGTKELSIALVIIVQNGKSLEHYHKNREEIYIVLEGKGRVVIDGEETTIEAGDVLLVPTGKVHQVFNDHLEDLKFYCGCAPSWEFEDFNIGSENPDDKTGKRKIHKKAEKDCVAIVTATGQIRRQLLEKSEGAAAKHTVTLIEMPKGCTSTPETPDAEGGFLIKEGKGKLMIGDKEKEVTAGDVARIPAGVTHKISTIGDEILKFYSVRV